MGAWGSGSFENDPAGDFADAVAGTQDLTMVRDALRDVVGPDYQPDVDTDSMGLAAAEIIASLLGAAPPDLPEELEEWLARTPLQLEEGDVALALAAVDRIESNSDLSELWGEDDELCREWHGVLADLKRRLGRE